MRRLLLVAIFLSAASASAQPRPPLTLQQAISLFVLRAGGSTIGGTTTVNNLTINGTCIGCTTGAVLATRTISTTSPLGGGGDLSADRTLTCTTCATSSNNLSFFSATSSAQLATLLNDETGFSSGALAVFSKSPVIETPTIASFTNATHNHQNAAGGGTLGDAAITFTAPALGAPTATTVQTSGNVGVGAAPSAVAGEMLVATDNFNGATIIRASNPDATDTGSLAALEVLGGATVLGRLQAHQAGRTATRLGVTLANYVELFQSTGNGLLIDTTGANPVIVGTGGLRAITISGSTQAVSLCGSQTNDSATAGDVGELISGTVAANTTSLSTNTTANVGTNTNITLTAGDWDCDGVVNFTFGATTSITNLTGGVSTTTATLPAQDSYFDYETSAIVPTGSAVATWVVPTVNIKVANATTTPVFLVSQATFTVSTIKVGGTIRCRRMR